MTEKSNIDGLLIFTPEIYLDERGYFFESYNKERLKNNIDFVQDNESKSKFGTLRGIHFQKGAHQQSKLVRVIKGEVQDVAVDLRPKSKTYKKYFSIVLNDENKKQLFIPRGFGHAFLTLSDYAIVSYKVDSFYNKNSDAGIKFDDPSINIKWLLDSSDIILSNKDKDLPVL